MGSILHSALSSLIALSALYGVFLSPLNGQAKDMHLQQLDPTDIVKIPYDLKLLFLYVIGCLGLFVILSKQRIQYLKLLIRNTTLCTGAMVLCGASPYHNQWHTVLASLYLCSLAQFSIIPAFTIAGAVPAQILLLYDNGWQIQRWPVPVILGSTYGWIIGEWICGTLSPKKLHELKKELNWE